MKKANSKFEIKSWDEKPYHNEPKLTRAAVNRVFRGDLEGESTLEYLMAYHPSGSAAFVGMEHFVGRVGTRSGSFLFQHSGTFDGKVARDQWTVVPGSGTGALRGLRGEVSFAAGHEKEYPITFEYDFEES